MGVYLAEEGEASLCFLLSSCISKDFRLLSSEQHHAVLSLRSEQVSCAACGGTAPSTADGKACPVSL